MGRRPPRYNNQEIVMDDLLQRIERNLREYNAVRVDADYEKIAQDVLNPERLAEQWKQIWQASGEACQAERRILEIGSGFGGFVKYAAEQGIESVGIEIEAERVKISYDLLKRSTTKNALVLEGGEGPLADFFHLGQFGAIETDGGFFASPEGDRYGYLVGKKASLGDAPDFDRPQKGVTWQSWSS